MHFHLPAPPKLPAKKNRKKQNGSTDAASCGNVTSVQVSVCNAGENQAGSAITWCSDASCMCFYSIIVVKMLQVVISDQPSDANNDM